MAFTIRGMQGMQQLIAQQKVTEALEYLRQSQLARSILADLEEHADVCIDVDTGTDPYYAHPESRYDTVTTGGTAVWNPDMSVQTTDSSRMRGWDGGFYADGSGRGEHYLAGEMKKVPESPWIPKTYEREEVEVQKRGLSKRIAKTFHLSPTRTVRRNRPAKKYGRLSAPMCLMHELGHALQYATYPDQYRDIKGWDSKSHAQHALETTNLQCVEIPVAIELSNLGFDETPRWDYGHTGHQ